MKTIKIIICTGLLFGALTGCSSQPVETTEMSEVTDYSVVGKWNGKSSDNTISYDFKEDGTYVTSQTNAKGEKGKEVSGTYTYSEDTLTLTEKDKDPVVSQVLFENSDVMILVTAEKESKEENKDSKTEEKVESKDTSKETTKKEEKTESKAEEKTESKDTSKEETKTEEKTEPKEETKTESKAEEKTESKDEEKVKKTEIRFVRDVDKRNVVFTNGTELNIKKVTVKSEKDEDHSSNLLEDKGKDLEGLFVYSFDPDLKYEIKLETKERKAKLVSQNSKEETKTENADTETKEYIIKDFNAADMNEATIKLKNDICYVEYVSLATGEKKDTYVEPKKEEPKPAPSSGQNIDTSMAGTYYLQGNMNVRTGAGYDAGVITVYTAGTAVSVVGTITNPDGSIWAKLNDGTYICYRDGNGQYLGTAPPAGGGASAGTYVALYEMNVRAAPSTASASYGTIPAGSVFSASEVVYGSDGSVWLHLSRNGEPAPETYVCYQNSGGTYCAPY